MRKIFYFLALLVASLFSTNSFAQLAAGTYSVGPTAGTYATIGDAVNALSSGIDGLGYIIFEIEAGTYINDPIDISMVSGTSPTSLIIFKSASGITDVSITNSTTALSIFSTQYLRFQNLALQTTAVDTQGKVIRLDGSCANIEFLSVMATGRTDLTDTETSEEYATIYMKSTAMTAMANNIQFNNVTVTGGTYGFYFGGDPQMDSGNISISGCSINSQIASSISMENIESPSITSCTIESGILVENIITFSNCNATVIDMNWLISSAVGPKTCINALSDNFQFTNNLLYSSGDNTQRVDGIFLESANGSIRNNTIRITDGDQSGAAIYSNSEISSLNAVENNIVMITGLGRAFDFYGLTGVSPCSYNCISSNHMFTFNIAGIGSIADLTTWQSHGYGTGSIITAIPFGGQYDYQTDAGSPTVDAGNPETDILSFPIDKDGQPRIYNNGLGGRIDIGAKEVQAEPIFADAGIDSDVCGFTTLNANVPGINVGTWSVTFGAATFSDINSPISTVTNLGSGDNGLRWTVTDGSSEVFDEVVITNSLPFIDAGIDQNFVGLTAQVSVQLQATSLQGNETGQWTVSGGTPTITNPSVYNTTVTNLNEGYFIFTWTVTNGICTQTDEMTFDNLVITSYAGEDISGCNNSITMGAQFTEIGEGSWSILSGGGTFSDINDPYSQVTNIPSGDNTYIWSVTVDGVVATDNITITNNIPVADAGTNQYILTDQIGNLITTTTLSASILNNEETGIWTIIAGSAVLSDLTTESPTVNALIHGNNIFRWTVSNTFLCSVFDDILVTSGYSISSAPTDGSLDWSNPADWDVNTIPSAGDSVTISNCTAIIAGGNAECSQLIIGSGSTFTVEGTARAVAVLRTGSLLIEQTAERFPDVRGTANMVINGDATVYIDGQLARNSRAASERGLRIGSGGSLLIEQTAERSTRAIASLRIGSGRSLLIEQTAERNNNAVANASLRIGSGGSLLIEQTAERSTRNTSSAPALKIGSGGELLIENNSTTNSPASVIVGANNTIEVSSNTTNSANLTVRGGSLLIEQTAERDTRAASIANLIIGRRGSLLIEQSAERGESSVHAPGIVITNGTVVVGTPNIARNRAVATGLYTRSLLIEQSAERVLAAETNLTVNANAGLYIETGSISSEYPILTLKKGATVTFNDGAEVDLFDSNFAINANLILEKGSSLIDMNATTSLEAEQKFEFEAETLNYVSSAFSNSTIDNFLNIGEAYQWEEVNVDWAPVSSASTMNTMKGYGFMPDLGNYTSLFGTLNTGAHQIQLTNDGSTDIGVQGWNLVGNPYPSAIDFETMDFSGINNTVYFYDAIQKNYRLYQMGGISTNGATQFALPGEGFFLKTEGYFTLSADNENRVHYIPGAQPAPTRQLTKLLKLKVQGNGYSDEAVVHFKEAATQEYDTNFDALKKNAYHGEVPQLFTVTTTGNEMAINTLPYSFENSTTVELSFYAGNDGNFTISTEQLIFNNDVAVQLIDNKTSTTTDLRTTATYTFSYSTNDIDERFTIVFGSGINSIEKQKNSNITIFATNKDIFVQNAITENLEISVYSITGALVHQSQVSNSLQRIKTNLPSGIYIVKAVSEVGAKTERVVIK